MPSIFVKDDLRASVEAASGGKQTVLYTASGQPCYMNIIPKFNLQDIDVGLGTGVHPAFIVGGAEKTELFIGSYPGIRKKGELLSLPCVNPSTDRTIDGFITDVRLHGAGWHLASNVEYAALALWCWKNGFMPRGNTNYGRSSDALWETARRQDGGAPGAASGSARTLTGSGPASWRHDNTPGGISDLCGNVWEWAPGLRIAAGEIQIITDNDAALFATDHSATSAAWRAINAVTGELMVPTFTGTISAGTYVATTVNSVRYAVAGTANYTLVRASGSSFEGMTNPGAQAVADAALRVLKQHCIYPVAPTGLGADVVLHIPGSEQMAIRGGSGVVGAGSGVFALHTENTRTSPFASLGARPAFVL